MSTKRNYKADADRRNRRRIRIHGLLVILLLVVALFSSLLAYISKETTRSPGLSVQSTEEFQNSDEVSEPKSMPPPVKPKYDFYEVLPEQRVVIPKDETSQRPATRNSNRNAGVTGSGQRSESPSYVVQVGAFRKFADADRHKANVAFLGVSSRIEKTTDDNGRLLHRVLVGPVQDQEKVNRLRRQLSANDIESFAIRIR